jgi:diguanylate cyclase (GGDEF)-like protein
MIKSKIFGRSLFSVKESEALPVDFLYGVQLMFVLLSIIMISGSAVHFFRMHSLASVSLFILLAQVLVVSGAWLSLEQQRYNARIQHLLVITMILGFSGQAALGHAQHLAWTIPLYLAWTLVSPTFTVALVGLTIAFLVTLINPAHQLDPANLLLALAGAVLTHSVKLQVIKLSATADTDVLTGALNRRQFALALIDIDDFKAINDSLGHAVGDRVLSELTLLIQQRIRQTDAVFRIGGDEFVVILVGISAESAQGVVEDIRKRLSSMDDVHLASLRFSAGLCDVENNTTVDMWLDRADKALYQAKGDGGNMACLAR